MVTPSKMLPTVTPPGRTLSSTARPMRSVRSSHRRMPVRTRHLILSLLLVLCSVAACAQVADEQLVDNAYPADLFASRDPDAPSRFSTFVAADLNRNGQLLLVALYTNGTRAGISVLDRSGHVLSHPDLPFLKGFRGELEAIDLDGDGVP